MAYSNSFLFKLITRWSFVLVLGCLLVLLADARADDVLTQGITISTDADDFQLYPVPIPNVSNTEETVQEVLQATREKLAAKVLNKGTTQSELAQAFGEMGELYQAHHISIPAGPCYRNAAMLANDEFRWPYYLGYLAQQTHQLDVAEEAFQRAVRIRPDYVPAQLRLAQVYIDQNKHDLAEPLLRHTVTTQGLKGASLFGLGQIAFARRDYEKSVALLEQALEKNPQASRIHYTLAMAYRSLGNIEKAKIHLTQHGDGKPEIIDAEIDRLSELMSGVKTIYHHALDAVRTREYDVAAKAFAAALKREPDNVDARVSLARSLYLSGYPQQALQQLRESVRQAPNNDLAQFLLGVLLDERGEVNEALEHYRKTLSLKPDHSGAHHYLGNVLVSEGKYTEAAQHLEKAYRQVPQNMPARMMEVIALILGQADQGVIKGRLEGLYKDYPGQPIIAYTLARLLAASPDGELRDAQRAMEMVQSSLQGFMPMQHAETMAMAYAEMGRFDDAVTFQISAISSAFSMGMFDTLPSLEATLALYKEHKPCRTPWLEDDPMFALMPVDASGPFRDYPANRPY